MADGGIDTVVPATGESVVPAPDTTHGDVDMGRDAPGLATDTGSTSGHAAADATASGSGSGSGAAAGAGASSEPVDAAGADDDGDEDFVPQSGAGAGAGAGARPSPSPSPSPSSASSVPEASAFQKLVEQTESLARILAGEAQKADDKKKKRRGRKPKAGGGGGGRRRSRKTEAEEDEELVTNALEEREVVRLKKQPPNIENGTMREYQVEGLNWMIHLHDCGLNGILADEMGLGKTLQTISLLAYLKSARGNNGPHLVVVPMTTLGNWMREFKRWCPTMKCLKLHASKKERGELAREVMLKGDHNVICTTYEVVKLERASLRKMPFDYIVVDEAHRLKNEHSTLSLELRQLQSKHRLLLTGTPLQNNLHELWALLNFLLPQMFADSDEFDSYFNLKNTQQEDVMKKLHSILRPFLLRRLKNDVEHSLLPKMEMKVYVGLTRMQQQWYKRVLSKDAAQLNSLGGADKVRLLNILMQLRKVTNHPYLFEGAEPGPPFQDGPHLWENAGKMMMLDKLLMRLKEQGSRVLIFSQMTRMLDILDDYMVLKGYPYCRIDGNTKGQLRDDAVDAFNVPGSEKFCFLLSTRAGGLGINLATADVVILYDSDWNPQMDLQAMDRAHRIGQKKQVRVFRFISEGTVEEKIIERADRKLYLDAVVIQQGRLAQQNTKLSKDELMSMVKFGANKIFRTNDATVSDSDIDKILEESKRKADAAAEKVKKDMSHNLSNFELNVNDDGNMYEYNGVDFSALNTGEDHAQALQFISLPQRERKRNYDVNEYFRDALRTGGDAKTHTQQKLVKVPQMQEYQFFDKARIEVLIQKENDLAIQRKSIEAALKEQRAAELRERKRATRTMVARLTATMSEEDALKQVTADLDAEEAKNPPKSQELEERVANLNMPEDEMEEKEQLIEAGFSNWKWRDFRTFVSACEKHGRANRAAVVAEVTEMCEKTVDDVEQYFDAFWEKGPQCISDWKKLNDRIVKGEQRIARRIAIEKAIAAKVGRHPSPLESLTIGYGSSKGKGWTLEEDRFLLVMLHQLGYGAWDSIRNEVRRAWQFRFDWFMKSRTSVEIQRRCETLIRLVEKEAAKKSAPAGPKKRKRDNSASAKKGGKKGGKGSKKGAKKGAKGGKGAKGSKPKASKKARTSK